MFKKALGIFMFGILLTGLAACGNGNETPQPTEPEPVIETVIVEQVPEPPVEAEPEGLLPGRIAIVTNTFVQNPEEYISAQYILNKFGEEYVIHRTWPLMFMQEGEMMIEILQEIANDPDVRVLIINQAVENTNAAVEAFRERRDDVFVIYASPNDSRLARDHRRAEGNPQVILGHYNVIAENADLIFNTNRPTIGYHFVRQAVTMGAETIIHYSSSRHMAVPHLAARRDGIRDAAEAAGIAFHDLDSYDPLIERSDFVGLPFFPGGGWDVSKRVAEFGVNTAFFSTLCRHQLPILDRVFEYGAIYVQPCCPSPFHVFPVALGIAANQSEALEYFSPAEMIEAIRKEVIAADVTGRISTIPLPDGMLFTYTAVEYGIKWMRGEVSKEEIDLEVLSQIMVDVIAEQTGVEGLGVNLTKHEFEGNIFPNFILVTQDYLTF